MKTLTTLSGGMKKFANKKFIIPLLILLIAILMLMQKGPFGSERIEALSAGFGTLDMKYGYSASETARLFDQLGNEGRLAYNHLLYLDFGFALVYMTLQSLLITALIRKAGLGAKWEKLNLIPFVRSALDFVENVLLLSLLAGYPVQHTAAVGLASVLTVIKLTINYGYIALVFFLGALTTRQTMLRKTRNQKYYEMRQGA